MILKRIHKHIFLLLLCYTSGYGQHYKITERDENVKHYQRFGNYEIFENVKEKTYFITNAREKTLVEGLKFCKVLSTECIQALNKKNELVYFNDKVRTVKTPVVNYVVCGTVNDYTLKLIKQNDTYFVETKTDRRWTGGENTTEITDTLTNRGYDTLYFVNHKQYLSFDDNDILPTYLIYEKGTELGIIDKGILHTYDTITVQGPSVKVEKSGRYNYYHLSPDVKYKRLDDYVFDLAYFELENGKSGYIDKQGKEYYN